ncbi:MAG: hypothetical protein R3D89_07915 [Sphingomonadaceae bacterium]
MKDNEGLSQGSEGSMPMENFAAPHAEPSQEALLALLLQALEFADQLDMPLAGAHIDRARIECEQGVRRG